MRTEIAERAAPTTKELVDLALLETWTAHDNYARDFMARIMAGESPSEWDYAAAMIAVDVAAEIGAFLEAKK